MMDGGGLGLGFLSSGRIDHTYESPDQLGDALAGHRRDGGAVEVVAGGHVGAAADHQAGPVQQIGPIVGQLAKQDLELGHGSNAVVGSQIQQHEQGAGPFDMAQEPVTETLSVAGTLDQARNVGEDHLESVVGAHHAEVGLEGGEGIVGDLRFGR